MTQEEIQNLMQMHEEKLADKILEDGTIIETTIYTYPTRKVTVENTITPKMQEDAIAKVAVEVAEKQATVEKFTINLEAVKPVIK